MAIRWRLSDLVGCLLIVSLGLSVAGSSAAGADLRKRAGRYSVVNSPMSLIGLTSTDGLTGRLTWQKANAKPLQGVMLPLGDSLVVGLTGMDRNPGVVVYKIDQQKGLLQGVGAIPAGRFYEACQAMPDRKGVYRIVKAKNSQGEAYQGYVTLKKQGGTYLVTHRRDTKAGSQEWQSTGVVRNGNLICGWGSLAIYEPAADHAGFLLGKVFTGDKVEEQVLRKLTAAPVVAANPGRVAPPAPGNPVPRNPAVPGQARPQPLAGQPAMAPRPMPLNAGVQQLGPNFLWQAHVNIGLVADGVVNKAIPLPVARLQVNVTRANLRRFRAQLRGMVVVGSPRMGNFVASQSTGLIIRPVAYQKPKSDNGLKNLLSSCDAVEQQCAALEAYLNQSSAQNAQAFDASRKATVGKLEQSFGPLSSLVAARQATSKTAPSTSTGSKSVLVGSRRAAAGKTTAIQTPLSPSRFATFYAQSAYSAVPTGGSEKLSFGTLSKCMMSELSSGMGLIADGRRSGMLDALTAQDLCRTCGAFSSNCMASFNSVMSSGSFSQSDRAFCLDCANCCQTCRSGFDALSQYCANGNANSLASFDKYRSEFDAHATDLCGVRKQAVAASSNADGLSVDEGDSLASEREAALSKLSASEGESSDALSLEEGDGASSDSLFGGNYVSGDEEGENELSLSRSEESFFDDAEKSLSEAGDLSSSGMEFEETPLEFQTEASDLSELSKQAEEVPLEMEADPALSVPEGEGSPSEPAPGLSTPEEEEAGPGRKPNNPEPSPSPSEPSPSEPGSEPSSEPSATEPTPSEPAPSESEPSAEPAGTTPEEAPSAPEA